MIDRIAIGHAAGWSWEVVPSRGASVSRLAWRAPDGRLHDILHRPTPQEIDDRSVSLSKLSSFLMLPFANRIDGAAFTYDGQRRTLPLNRPEQGCAIHGHAREAPWTVVENTAARLVCDHELARDDTPWRYRAEQVFDASEEAARLTVSVENRGEAALPFGFGLHPWFPRTPKTRLQFHAAVSFDADARTFPTAVVGARDDVRWDLGAAPADRLGLDRGYAGWLGPAMIEQPDFGYRVALSGDGAFGNLHIFVPSDRDAFCAEPVTHVTDVVNRRAFAPYGDMARLEPGERLTASMTLRAEAL